MDTPSIFWGIALCAALLLGLGGYVVIYRRRSGDQRTGTPETSPRDATEQPAEQASIPQQSDVSPLQTAPAEYLERCSRMAGVFAHDFNNIMTAIGGFASMLKKRLGDDEKAVRYINGIIEAEKHASKLLDRLSLIAGNDAHYTVTFDVNEVIREVCAAHTSDVNTVEILPPEDTREPLLSTGDPKRFRMAIAGLCDNAIDACRENGGTVRFTTETQDGLQDSGIALPAALAPGEYLRISVVDSGCGMNSHVREHLFDPFFTTKPKGKAVGLGLSFVWRYATSCKGTVELETAPGKGTTFHLYLPRQSKPIRTEATSTIGTSADSPASTGPLSVLVVDDEQSVREIYTEILEDNGYSVASCANGREACNYIDRTATPVDLVVLDVMMPVMDGITTFSVLRNSHPNIKILLMSGYNTTNTVSDLLKQPATAFFEKPGSSDLLLEKITSLLAD